MARDTSCQFYLFTTQLIIFWATTKNWCSQLFLYLSGNPVILSKYQLYVLHDCVSCQGLWPYCSSVCWAPHCVLTFTEMYQRIKTYTQLKKLLVFSCFSLFPTTCFLSSPCQVIYTMTNELWRHAMNLKTPIIKNQWDERDRPHISHMKFQLLLLYDSLIYQWWAGILILGGTVHETGLHFWAYQPVRDSSLWQQYVWAQEITRTVFQTKTLFGDSVSDKNNLLAKLLALFFKFKIRLILS